MKQNPKKYAEGLIALCGAFPRAKTEQVIQHVVKYFARRGKIKFLRMVAYELARCIKKQQGRIDVSVLSAHEMPKHTLQECKNVLEKHCEGIISFNTRVNTALIAGSIITIEDRMIDCSLSSRLHALQSSFRRII